MSAARQIEEQAALWVIAREEPSWTATDQARLDGWLAESDAHKVAFWRLEYGWREADRIASLGEIPGPKTGGIANGTWWTPLALAASLLLVFTIFLTQWPSVQPARPPLASPTRYETPIGGHQFVRLHDGSRVELNTDTVIRADVSAGRRRVWIDRGEAFFEIAKKRGQKFVIYAGLRTITVLGTKFSVRRDDGKVVVAVLEGRVRLEDFPAAPNSQALVTAGDVAITTGRSTLVTNSARAVRQELAWRSGQLLFNGELLAAAVEEFNRYNRTQIVLGDANAGRMTVSGQFDARNIDAFASLLESAYGLDAVDRGDRIVLSTKRMASRNPLKHPELMLSPVKNAVAPAVAKCGSEVNPCEAAAPVKVEQAALPPSPEQVVRNERNWTILHKLYPPRALQAGEEGLVGFTVKLDSAGDPTSCKVTQSSGHPLLDLETCQLIMVHAMFRRPAGISRSQQLSYEGVVDWKLPPALPSSNLAAPKSVARAAAAEEMICRRFLQTGSNVAVERICMPKSEWQRAANVTREYGERLQRKGGGN